MPELKYVDREGHEVLYQASTQMTLLDNIKESGNGELMALCGGGCSCATCHVYVDEGWIDKVGVAEGIEKELLDALGHRRDNSRLACQIDMRDELDGLRVTIAPED